MTPYPALRPTSVKLHYSLFMTVTQMGCEWKICSFPYNVVAASNQANEVISNGNLLHSTNKKTGLNHLLVCMLWNLKLYFYIMLQKTTCRVGYSKFFSIDSFYPYIALQQASHSQSIMMKREGIILFINYSYFLYSSMRKSPSDIKCWIIQYHFTRLQVVTIPHPAVRSPGNSNILGHIWDCCALYYNQKTNSS